VSLGLYLQIPFCASLCHYCNFNRGLLDGPLKERYLRALLTEIGTAGRQVAEGRHPATGGSLPPRMPPAGIGSPPSRPAAADTIYFGGGTPSLLEPPEVAAIVDACRSAFDVAADAEITLETNPETVTPDRMAGFRAAGVNRASLGVQSFRDVELQRLGRIHSSGRVAEAMGAIRAAAMDNLSLDLMMWLPGQTVGDWMESVDALVAASPEHASLYLLELYPNAPLREDMARAGCTQAPDDDAADMYEAAIDRLAAAGYEHYEISNFARSGRRSRHNLKYWTAGEWLGLGCGAHSTLAAVRWKNVSATADYVQRIESGAAVAADLRVLEPARHLEEDLFMGLRLIEGIDLEAITRHYAVDVWERYGDRLQRYLDAGLLARAGRRLRLTRRGLLLSNEVMAVFIDPTVR
jgi:oxygen-independent coproporphyrinogen-3 oxidase